MLKFSCHVFRVSIMCWVGPSNKQYIEAQYVIEKSCLLKGWLISPSYGVICQTQQMRPRWMVQPTSLFSWLSILIILFDLRKRHIYWKSPPYCISYIDFCCRNACSPDWAPVVVLGLSSAGSPSARQQGTGRR
jgi:hypothetical protein